MSWSLVSQTCLIIKIILGCLYHTSPQGYSTQIFKEGTCDFDDQENLGNTEIQGIPHFIGLRFSALHKCGIFCTLREGTRPAKRWWLSLLWDSLYRCGLELNLQHLRHVLVVYMQGIGKDCIGVDNSGCFKDLRNYGIAPWTNKLWNVPFFSVMV